MDPKASSSKVLPQGYTFMNPELFISEKAKEMIDDLLQKAENRNPDSFEMYVYNDYFAYALHNLIELSLTSIRSKVTKKNWLEAFYAIEALTVFFDIESAWATCDDGALTKSTNKLYGALLLSILKGLKDTNQLDVKTIPNLETILRVASELGECMKGIGCKSEYVTTCKAVANRLFKDTTTADVALYEARLREHAETIQDPKEKEMVLEGIEEYLAEVGGEKTWYLKGKIGSDEIKIGPSVLTRAWNDYRGQAPPVPFKGPPEWDLTKWTDKQKEPFAFSNMGDMDDMDEFDF